MKKLAISLIVCLAYIQSAQAATTALTESLLEYEAITNFIGAPNFSTIGPDEFIVDIERITRRVDVLGIVKYGICTRLVTAAVDNIASQATDDDLINSWNHHSDQDENSENNGQHRDYVATLTVTPNPGIGPNIVTVNSIVRVCRENP